MKYDPLYPSGVIVCATLYKLQRDKNAVIIMYLSDLYRHRTVAINLRIYVKNNNICRMTYM